MNTSSIVFRGISVGLATFGLGLVFVVGIKYLSTSTPLNPTSVVTTETAKAPTPDGAIDLLPDDLGCWDEETERYGPIRIGNDRVLSTICGTLFVRDEQGNIVWEAINHAPLTDEPKLIGSTLVMIGFDLQIKGYDVTTGRKLWAFNGNGRRKFVQLEKFDHSNFLVRVDLSEYDSLYQGCIIAKKKGCKRQMADAIWLFNTEKIDAESVYPISGAMIRPNSRIKRIRERIHIADELNRLSPLPKLVAEPN